MHAFNIFFHMCVCMRVGKFPKKKSRLNNVLLVLLNSRVYKLIWKRKNGSQHTRMR